MDITVSLSDELYKNIDEQKREKGGPNDCQEKESQHRPRGQGLKSNFHNTERFSRDRNNFSASWSRGRNYQSGNYKEESGFYSRDTGLSSVPWHKLPAYQRNRATSVENVPSSFVNDEMKRSYFSKDVNRNSEKHTSDKFRSQSSSTEMDIKHANQSRQIHSQSGQQKKEMHHGFNQRGLNILINKDSNELMMELTVKKNDFNSLLKSELQPIMIMQVVQILVKVSDTSMKVNKAELLTYCVHPDVLKMFSSVCCRFVTEDHNFSINSIVNYFENLSIFFNDVVEILPNTATDCLMENINQSIMSILSLRSMKQINVPAEIEQKFNQLLTIVSSMIEERKPGTRQQNKLVSEWKPSGRDFRDLSIYPSPQDVLSRPKVQLKPVIIDGPYKNVEHYLEVQFSLMREDFLMPLRNGIMNFIQQKSDNNSRLRRIENVRFYNEVRLLTQRVEGDTLVTEVLFDPNGRMRKVDWKRSKKFLFGTLVCFSSDYFKSLFLGIIVNRDVEILEKGILRCEFVGEVKETNLFGKVFTMAESEVYFEAYQHVMKALKHFNEINFPLQEYIINVTSEKFLPNYLALNPGMRYNFKFHKFQLLDQSTWPNIHQLKVNQSQFNALHSALTQKMVVIQGPPGTGKTYLGLIIAEILLRNSDHWRGCNPGQILVVCFTNHALDQFLEGILSFTHDIVRIGGQSKNEKLAEYNLRVMRRKRNEKLAEYNLRGMRRKRGTLSKALSNVDEELRELTYSIIVANAFIKQSLKKSGIFSVHYLKTSMEDWHSECFRVHGVYKDSLFVEWLLEGAFYQNDSNSEVDYRIPSLPEDSAFIYACTLFYLYSSSVQIERDMAGAGENEYLYLNNIREIYLVRFSYLKKKLIECVSEDNNLIMQLQEVRRLHNIPHEHRWVLYNYWLSEAVKHNRQILAEHREIYRKMNNQKLEILDAVHLETISDCKVIGITTTGAAKHQTLLQKLGAKIVIVEEAAEVMESHVVVSLSKECEHLILIGDHKQLKPSPAVYHLAKNYNFDVSLFERMLNNKVPYDTLNIQHRMRPEIADLIVPAIYPSLENHHSVLEYEKIQGLEKNLFFITHKEPEQRVMDDTSKKNIHEAQFLIALCRHLILQGYHPSQITILTTYIGQMFYLMEEREKTSKCKEVRITCVDNFQGEENDIILLSLVRNNDIGKIGFLAVENRVCVALSRARKGLYVMGNIDMLCNDNPLWRKIKGVLEKKDAIGTHLVLQCLHHQSQLTRVCKADDFRSITEGGCTLMCETKLNCGHTCKKMCHMEDHERYHCNEVCGKKMCIHDHRCKKLCWMDCGNCLVPLECQLPCGHKAILPCYKEPTEHLCEELVDVELPDCKHTVTKKCYIDIKEVNCTFPCDSRLPCGHVCAWKCHVKKDPEHLDYKCERPCERKNLQCNEEHMCQRKCFEECNLCIYKVKRKLPNCDHFYDMQCYVDPESYICSKPCKKMLPCGHKCPLKCHEFCGGCQIEVVKEIPDCKHKMKMKCCNSPQRNMCTRKCERVLICGHVCRSKCGLPCGEKKCEELLRDTAKSPCGHQVRIYCHEKYSLPEGSSLMKRCFEPCSKTLECTHKCKGTCGTCLQGKVHLPCEEKCGRVLICGHVCTVACSQTCPPCIKKCFIKCDHSKCKKNCGSPCVSCKEECGWQCEHLRCTKKCGEMCDRGPCNEPCKKVLKCKHPCIGYCGEKCPPLCRICDADEIDDILAFLGSDDENARFVFLPDCKHVFDSEGMEKWLSMDAKTVKMRVCPTCSTPIQNAYRYGNIIKQHFINVMKVKQKIFGNMKQTKDVLSWESFEIHEISARPEFAKNERELKEMVNLMSKNNKLRLDAFSLNSLQIRSQFVISVVHNFEKMESKINRFHLTEYTKVANMLLKIILRRLDFISNQEHSDITAECMRFHLSLNLCAVDNALDSRTYTDTRFLKEYEEIKNLLSSPKPFPTELYDATQKRIDDLYKEVKNVRGVGLTKVEMSNIVQALNMDTGTWNVCPKNHVYVIGNCGGAMVEGICNECGATSGGSHHHLQLIYRRLERAPTGSAGPKGWQTVPWPGAQASGGALAH